MKKEVLFLIIALCSTVVLQAQVTIGGMGINSTTGGTFGNMSYVNSAQRRDGNTFISFDNESAAELENIYLSKLFFQGVLLTDDKKIDTTNFFRYNVSTDQIEIGKKNQQVSTISKPLSTKIIAFGGKSFVYELIADKKGIYAGYFELIAYGKAKLLLKRYGKARTDKYMSRYGGGGGTGKEIYTIGKIWYYQINDQGAKKLKNSKSFYKKIFADQKEEISKFFKENKPDIKTPEGKKSLFDFYNSLHKSKN